MVKFPANIYGSLRELANFEPDEITWNNGVCFVHKDDYTYVFVPIGNTVLDIEEAFPGSSWEKTSSTSFRLRRSSSESPVEELTSFPVGKRLTGSVGYDAAIIDSPDKLE